MKYLKSASSRSYAVGTKVIPSNNSTKVGWLSLTDEEYASINQIPVIKSLIQHGDVLVTDTEPADFSKTPDVLINANAQLRTKLNDASKTLTDKEEEIAELKAKLAAAEAAAATSASETETETETESTTETNA